VKGNLRLVYVYLNTILQLRSLSGTFLKSIKSIANYIHVFKYNCRGFRRNFEVLDGPRTGTGTFDIHGNEDVDVQWWPAFNFKPESIFET